MEHPDAAVGACVVEVGQREAKAAPLQRLACSAEIPRSESTRTYICLQSAATAPSVSVEQDVVDSSVVRRGTPRGCANAPGESDCVDSPEVRRVRVGGFDAGLEAEVEGSGGWWRSARAAAAVTPSAWSQVRVLPRPRAWEASSAKLSRPGRWTSWAIRSMIAGISEDGSSHRSMAASSPDISCCRACSSLACSPQAFAEARAVADDGTRQGMERLLLGVSVGA